MISFHSTSLFIQSIAFKFSFLVLQLHFITDDAGGATLKLHVQVHIHHQLEKNFWSIYWFFAKHHFWSLFVSLDESELVFTAKKSDQSDGSWRWLGFQPNIWEGDLLVFVFVFVVVFVVVFVFVFVFVFVLVFVFVFAFVVFGLRANYKGGGSSCICVCISVCICVCIWASGHL